MDLFTYAWMEKWLLLNSSTISFISSYTHWLDYAINTLESTKIQKQPWVWVLPVAITSCAQVREHALHLSSCSQVALRRQQAQEEELGISHPVPLPSVPEQFIKKNGGGSSCLLLESSSPTHSTSTATAATSTPSGKMLGEISSLLGAGAGVIDSCLLFHLIPLSTVTVEWSPLSNNSVVLLVWLVKGRNPASIFHILFCYFHLKIKINLNKTSTLLNFHVCIPASSDLQGAFPLSPQILFLPCLCHGPGNYLLTGSLSSSKLKLGV